MSIWKCLWTWQVDKGGLSGQEGTKLVSTFNSSATTVSAYRAQADCNGKQDETAEKLQTNNVDSQPVHRTAVRNALGLFDVPSVSHLPPGYSVGHAFLKYVPHGCIPNCNFPLSLDNDAFKQLCKTNPQSCKHSSLITVPALLPGSMSTRSFICVKWDSCDWIVQSWEQWEFTAESVGHCKWQPVRNCTIFMDVCISLQRMRMGKRVHDPEWFFWLQPLTLRWSKCIWVSLYAKLFP